MVYVEDLKGGSLDRFPDWIAKRRIADADAALTGVAGKNAIATSTSSGEKLLQQRRKQIDLLQAFGRLKLLDVMFQQAEPAAYSNIQVRGS